MPDYAMQYYRKPDSQQKIVDRKQSEMAQTLQAWAKEFSPEYVLSFMCEEFGLEVEGVRNSSDVMEF